MSHWTSTYKHPDGLHFIIEHQEPVGYYIYVYFHQDIFEKDAGRHWGCPHHQEDDLQDTLEIAQRMTWKEYGMPMDSWVDVGTPPD